MSKNVHTKFYTFIYLFAFVHTLTGQKTTQKALSQCVCVCMGERDGGAFRGTVGTWQWHPETFLSLPLTHPFLTPHLFYYQVPRGVS